MTGIPNTYSSVLRNVANIVTIIGYCKSNNYPVNNAYAR